jgi:membrane fusion protein, multidrug efflux system
MMATALAGCGGGQADKQKAAPPPPPEVVVVQALQRDVPIYNEWIGTTEGDINADIRPQISGYLLRRVYQEGSFVHQGDLLFEIDPRQLRAALEQAQANLGQGQATLAKAQRDVARYRPLAAQRAVSQLELDNSIAAEEVAAANVESLKAQVDQAKLNLSWTRVTAPISGIAGLAVAQVGDLMNPQTVLATVSRVDPLRVRFNLSEQEYLRFRQKGEADPAAAKRFANLQMILADGRPFPPQGRLIFTDRQVDVKTGTIGAIGLFPNPGNLLRPGQYAKVRAEVDMKQGALLVPQRAVNELQGGYQIAVVGPGDVAEVRNVQVGPRLGDLWVIDKGLQPGDRVVVAGYSRVKSGGKVTPKSPQQASSVAGEGSGSGAGGSGGSGSGSGSGSDAGGSAAGGSGGGSGSGSGSAPAGR